MEKTPEYPTAITTGEFGYFARFFRNLFLAEYAGHVTIVPGNVTKLTRSSL